MEHNKEKQIEEMAKLLHLNYDMPYEFSKGLAEFLIDEGWCKASEVAREIFEKLEKHLRENIGDTVYEYYISGDLAELKKKYTEEGK